MAITNKPAYDLDVELVLVENNAKRKLRVAANITFERGCVRFCGLPKNYKQPKT